jgi:ankyrin repeat protein
VTRITFFVAGALLVSGASGAVAALFGEESPEEEAPIAVLVAEERLGELEERIRSGAAPEAGLTPAVRYGSQEALRLVLEMGANPTGLPASRALFRALREDLGWASAALTEAGVDLEGRDSYGRTLLLLAVQEGTVSRVRDLLSDGADVNARSNIGKTALMEAAVGGSSRKVKALLRSDADIEAVDRDGWTALAWAVRAEDLEVVRLLLSGGADPNHVDNLGWTPLLLASGQANPALVHQLLANRARPNLGTPAVGTALIRAVHGGNPDVVRLLLAYGADRRTRFDRRNALAWAKFLHRSDIVDLLTPRGRRP